MGQEGVVELGGGGGSSPEAMVRVLRQGTQCPSAALYREGTEVLGDWLALQGQEKILGA